MKESNSNSTIKIAGNFIYKVNDVLGVGTWGTVYKARSKDENDPKWYAVKKINKFKVEASQKSFSKYEAQVITLQKSNNIRQVIKIVDFFKTKSSYYIITQYLQNSVDLYDYMLQNKRKFCEVQARIIWYDLLNGIKKLHQNKIYHRDLKLQNILYVPNKCAKIIDFGMATLIQGTSSESFVGSPMFMSPQVIFNQKYSYKCDIWSLGIIFYCMICRVSPYGDTFNIKVIQQKLKTIEKEGVQYPEGVFISESCKQVIQSCLAYKEKNRRQINQILNLRFFDKQRKTDPDLIERFYQPQTTFKT